MARETLESDREFREVKKKRATVRAEVGQRIIEPGNDVYLSCCDVNWFVENQPHRRFPTTGVRCAALVSHVTGGVRKKAF